MSWFREKGAGGSTAIAAATASGVLADDSRELEKIRALGMSPRQLWLNHLWSRFQTIQYEARAVEWDGSDACSPVEREMMASSATIPPGFHASGDSAPLRLRKPLAPYHLFKIIVRRFSNLLFAEQRHPRITCPGDQAKEDFANGLVEASHLWTAMALARNFGGACGSVAVGFSFVDGEPMLELFEPFYCFPKFKSRRTLELEKIEIRWMYPVEERDDNGKWKTSAMWYRRIIDDQRDTVWEDVRAPKDKNGDVKEPDWAAPENAPEVVEHGFGKCPVKWIQNTRAQGDPEGEIDCAGALDMIERLDHLLSQGLQGVDLNCDPTLKFEGYEDSEMPSAVRKGSFNAIRMPKGTASFLELAGSGPDTAMKWILAARAWILEMCQCVLEDEQDATSGDAATATEVRKRYATMHARAGELREQYGQHGFLPLLEMMIDAARTLQAGKPAQAPQPPQLSLVGEGTTPQPPAPAPPPPGIIRQSVVVPPKVDKNAETGEVTLTPRVLPPQDSGVKLQTVWPEWQDPTPQDAQAATTAAVQAMTGGVIDLDTAVKYVSPFFKIEDTTILIANLKKQKEMADALQQQALVAGMYQGGPPPDDNDGGGQDGAPPAPPLIE